MSVLAMILVGALMGIVFGYVLEKSRVFEPGMIVGQMQLRNFIMLKVFLSAVATGLVVLAVLNGFGWAALHVKPAIYTANILGGLLLGAGIVLAGACPGTVMAQIGVGYRDAWVTLAGALVGAAVFGYLEPALKPALLAENAGKITFASLLGVPFWALAVVVAAGLVAVMAALERWRPWRSELGADYDGLLEPTAGKGHKPAPKEPTGPGKAASAA